MSNSASRRKAARLRHRQIRSKSRTVGPLEGVPRFAADVMLGRLAKWLRIAGFDVLYSNRITDDELVALSEVEDRVILSRDTRLLVRKVVRRFIYLESDEIRAQIRQVFRAAGTRRLPGLLTRCLTCNEVLQQVSCEEVLGEVPPFVYATQAAFKRCARCSKIYWAGTHRQAVLKTLEALFPGAESGSRKD
jgi:uncharacterized protein with PIN domain